MWRSLCTRQSLLASQVIRCHSTTVLKRPISLTLLKPRLLNNNIDRFLNIRRSLASSSIPNLKESTGEPVPVYKGMLSQQIKMVKVFSLATSVTGIFMQPILYKQTSVVGGLPMLVAMMSIVGFFTFVTPVLLHLVCKKYVITLDYDAKKNEYTALTYTFLMRKKFTKFTPEDVKVPEVPGMFTSIMIKDTPLFLDPSSFEDTEHYIKIMGYDKPIDFKLNLEEKMKGSDSKKTS